MNNENLRRFGKLLGQRWPVLVPAESEPGLDLPLGFAAQRHQSNNFTLKAQWKEEMVEMGKG